MSAVSLDEVKEALRITLADSDDEIQETIDAAEAILSHYVGPLEQTTVTERVYGSGAALMLGKSPVIELTSVTPVGGTALTVDDLRTDNGVVSYALGGRFSTFAGTYYDVVYEAGYAEGDLPADLTLAVKELTRHLWQTQRGPTPRPGQTTPDSAGAGYLLPYRVQQLVAPYKAPGIA